MTGIRTPETSSLDVLLRRMIGSALAAGKSGSELRHERRDPRLREARAIIESLQTVLQAGDNSDKHRDLTVQDFVDFVYAVLTIRNAPEPPLRLTQRIGKVLKNRAERRHRVGDLVDHGVDHRAAVGGVHDSSPSSVVGTPSVGVDSAPGSVSPSRPGQRIVDAFTAVLGGAR